MLNAWTAGPAHQLAFAQRIQIGISTYFMQVTNNFSESPVAFSKFLSYCFQMSFILQHVWSGVR